MFHIDRSNKVIHCVNTWDCTAPSIHYDTKEEAQKVADKTDSPISI